MIYPLVNVYIATEHPHFLGLNQRFLWTIFHSNLLVYQRGTTFVWHHEYLQIPSPGHLRLAAHLGGCDLRFSKTSFSLGKVRCSWNKMIRTNGKRRESRENHYSTGFQGDDLE